MFHSIPTRLAVAALLALAAITTVNAHGLGPLERLDKRLDLDEAQRTAISEILESSRKAGRDIREALRANREALRAVSGFDTYDAARVAELAEEQGVLQAERIRLKLDSRQQVMAVLTEQQRAEMSRLRERRHKRGHGPRWRRGPAPEGEFPPDEF